MGTLFMLIFRYVLGLNAAGGDYQTIAITASLDSLFVIGLMMLKKGK